MDRRFVVLVCSAAMLGLALVPAAAQQKTAKQCNDEWTANKTTIQASGKTKKVFIAECRGEPASAAPATPKPATTAAPKSPTTAAPRAAANVKTAKQCNDEWTANKAAIQASKKTKKDFIAECRAGVPTTAATPPAAAPAKPPTTAATPAPATPPAAAPARPPSTAAAPTTPPAATTRAPATGAPAAAGQFSSEAQAKARCPSDTVVWVNLDSKVYHFAGNRNYGTTKSGAYMCEKDTASAGFRAAKNEKHP
jgi:hypothetical protein